MHTILSRQIHLDFHTAGDIPNVGGTFDKVQFQEALQVAHVNWINIFAKCHHGYSYYPTNVGVQNPYAVTDNLLGKQIEACREIGVRPIPYITVGWSAFDSNAHPEWTARLKTGANSMYTPILCTVQEWISGSEQGKTSTLRYSMHADPDTPKPLCSWDFMCPTGEYAQLIYEQTREIVEQFGVSGLWYDITGYGPCFCNTCIRGMRDAGIDVEDDNAVMSYSIKKWKTFYRRCKEILYKKDPEATVFFNGSTLIHTDDTDSFSTFLHGLHEENTHQELEDLPSTWGGYDKLPIRAKLFSKTNKPLIAMSGKFHTAWGEFGGIKSANAMKYEAAAMMAFGAHCNFGDQLHPEGLMDIEAYKRIGVAFDYVEKHEDLIDGTKPYSNLALYYSGSQAEDEGIAYMLLQNQIDFDMVTAGYSIDSYETIIVPGARCLNKAEADVLNTWVTRGGKLLIFGESALDIDEDTFLFDTGVEYCGKSTCDIDYLKIESDLTNDTVFESVFLCYTPALKIKERDGKVLSKIYEPYYNRTYKHYCSHRYYPYKPEPSAYVGAVKKNNIVYSAHNLGKNYFDFGAKVHRDYFIALLSLVYKNQVLQVTGLGSAGRVNLLHQAHHKRYIVHLLYAPVHQRGQVQVVEEFPPISNVNVQIHVPEKIINIETRDGDAVSFEMAEIISVTIDSFSCHKAIILYYE